MSEIFHPNNQEKLIPLNDSNDNLEINSLIQKISTTPFDISMNIDENIKYNETLNSKAIILGNSSVGKTSILFRLLKNRFPEKYELNEFKFDTIKFQIRINELNITSKIELNIIDIPSKNKYDEFMEKNSSSCEIFIFVYSIDDLESFENINYWINEAKNILNGRNAVFLLLGNKIDENEKRKVLNGQSDEFDEKVDFNEEVSAKNGDNINEVFQKCFVKFYRNHLKVNYKKFIENITSNSDLELNLNSKKKCCCCCFCCCKKN